ncbi:MAG TPA: cupredoxin domain-containing protein [Chloroflexota bacterium]|nr:cupredoxin domain-containing protein [Chloroflexota bacterium]
MKTPALAMTLLAVLSAIASSGCVPAADAAAHATITFRYSRFVPEMLEVSAGVPVTITLRNDDPIEHEWIVGPPEVHAAHRFGTEPVHDTRPTEVTVPALSTRSTTLIFDRPGDYAYICHLPGHEAYGMRGILRVRSR